MRRSCSRLAVLMFICLLLITNTVQKSFAQETKVSFQVFYDELSPYGQWINDVHLGNVWVPKEDAGFRPYGSRGNWVMTDYGNTWISDDPWGWACYHYGRWTYDTYYGWLWIPGYEWSPAWVSWRFGSGYCGWAPLGPGSTIDNDNCPESYWIFSEPKYMYLPGCVTYSRGSSFNKAFIKRTSAVNNYYVDNQTHVKYNYGPRGAEIHQMTNQLLQVYHISQARLPGAANISKNTVTLYRPAVINKTATPASLITAPREIIAQKPILNSPTRQTAFRQNLNRESLPVGESKALNSKPFHDPLKPLRFRQEDTPVR